MKYVYVLLVGMFILIAWMLSGYLSIRNIEEPAYTVLKAADGSAVSQSPRIELRTYDAMLVAETAMPGPYNEAVNNGFRSIAEYIFGNNTTETSIAMTTPVLQEEKAKNQYTISFVMPSQYSIDAIPAPNNPNVLLRSIPSRTLGVISFSGLWTDSKARTYTTQLQNALESDGYVIMSEPEFARYNPPWTPPWMRRNEIWIEVEQ